MNPIIDGDRDWDLLLPLLDNNNIDKGPQEGKEGLERQLHELRDDKMPNLGCISNLEMESREMDMKKVEEDRFKVDQSKLELKNVIADKERTDECLTKQINLLHKLHNNTIEDIEAKLQYRAEKNALLENKLLNSGYQVTTLRTVKRS